MSMVGDDGFFGNHRTGTIAGDKRKGILKEQVFRVPAFLVPRNPPAIPRRHAANAPVCEPASTLCTDSYVLSYMTNNWTATRELGWVDAACSGALTPCLTVPS